MFLDYSRMYYWAFLYREKYGSVNMHNYMFNRQLIAINGEPVPVVPPVEVA